ncbi:hypothetical protein OIO90_001997 [Microbotryomycetes sp. JL221]|nr:hypothetical protein OIO90_001997 [Microbotryomycetes sp. JL221]
MSDLIVMFVKDDYGTHATVTCQAKASVDPVAKALDESSPMRIKAVLFDMDGLMIDSERIYTDVTNSIIGEFGAEMTWEIKAGIMGRPAHDAANYLIKATNLPLTPDELLRRMDVALEERFRTVKPLPGVARLVAHLAKHEVPMAIATGSKKKNFEIKSSHLGHLFDPFKGRVLCGDDPVLQGKGKPDPTIFLEAARIHLGMTEELQHVLVFEDGAPGVQAAKAAGMPVVWVPDVQLVATLGEGHGLNPTAQLETLEHFKPEEWGLPPYDA